MLRISQIVRYLGNQTFQINFKILQYILYTLSDKYCTISGTQLFNMLLLFGERTILKVYLQRRLIFIYLELIHIKKRKGVIFHKRKRESCKNIFEENR